MSVALESVRRRLLASAVVTATLISGVFVLALPGRSNAQEIDLANEFISRARKAALNFDFGGEIEVMWVEPGGRRRERIKVRSAAGVLTIGNRDQVVVEGTTRYARSAEGWEMLWGRERAPNVPAPSAKWELEVRGGPLVAGRTTREVTASDPETGRVRERRAFDSLTGILLRRELYDADGRRIRSASYVSITLPPNLLADDPPKTPAKSASHEPKAMKLVRSPFRAPSGVGEGFVLGGAYTDDEGTLQLFYSDGLFSVSIFQEEGELDRDSLRPGGEDRELGGQLVRQYEVPSGTVLMWDEGGLAYTTVSDAPADELAAIVSAFGEERSFTERVTDFVLGPFGW